ncbi:hypothetical protein [Peribacillus acanthi]|uniref:hypothetical protein n=1 Tax=Peribacillus acanthi TaxID=2171554 RepID=UPI000D3E921A|nr:hypothetical protein [Peribacillus acanthi]
MKIRPLVGFVLILILMGCSSSPYSKYSEEINLAYDYVHPHSQNSILNWKKAKVEEFTSEMDLNIIDEAKDEMVNIKGIHTLKVTFRTNDEESLGPIVVFIDKKNGKVLGIGGRK